MSALPPLRPADLDAAQQALYDTIAGGARAASAAILPVCNPDGSLAGPFNALLYSPALGTAVQQVGVQLRYASTFADSERELLILFVAGRLGSAYERYAHTLLAGTTGLDAEQIAACAAGIMPTGLGERERVLLSFAEALCAGRPDPALIDTVAATVGAQALLELTVLVGYYRLLDGVLHVAEVGAPDE